MFYWTVPGSRWFSFEVKHLFISKLSSIDVFLANDRSSGPPGDSCEGLGELLKLWGLLFSAPGEQLHDSGMFGFILGGYSGGVPGMSCGFPERGGAGGLPKI